MEKFLKQKLSTNTALLILGGISTLFVAFYFSLQFWINYKIERATELALQNEQKAQAELRDKEFADLKQQFEILKNKPPEIRTVTKIVEAKDTTSNIIKEWSKKVAYIECVWAYTNGTVYAKGSGSATLVKFNNLGLRAVTSKHVLLDKGQYIPRDCKVILSGGKTYLISSNDTNISIGINEDWAYLKITPDETLNDITKQDIKLCPSVEIGDKLLILGYPVIGSQTGLTVTEGILSGFDGNYYITSAKIDRGNSGGAAILIKDNCYLGIPSASVVGVIESLGRILKAGFVIQ